MGFFSGLAGIFGAKKAAKKIDPMAFFTPSSNVFASYTAPGQYNLTPFGKQVQRGFRGLGQQFYDEAMAFSRPDFASEYFDAIDRLQSRREGQAFDSYASRIFNVGGATTGTGRALADYQTDIQDAQMRRSMAAEQAAFNRQSNLFNRYYTNIANAQNFAGFQQQQQSPQRAYLEGVQRKQQADAQVARGVFDFIGNTLDSFVGFATGQGVFDGILGGGTSVLTPQYGEPRYPQPYEY